MADEYDVVVAGTGPVGLAAAVAAAEAGWSTCLVGPEPPAPDGRTAALLQGSVDLLDELGAWPAVAGGTGRLARLRIVDATGSLFRPPPVEFRADEIGLEAFGHNVENGALVRALAALASQACLTWKTTLVERFDPASSRLTLSDGTSVSGRLVVAADGRRSRVRQDAGVAVEEHRYPQAAFTTVFRHARPHEDVSTEFHTRTGPLTLVPLPGNRSSLVWVTVPAHARRLQGAAPAEVAEAVGRATDHLLGALAVDGPRGAVPLRRMTASRLTAPRLVLAGEAAHVLPPLGAQGLNLGFADVRALRDGLRRAFAAGGDPGAPDELARFERARGADTRIRSLAVDGLNRALLAEHLPVDAARGVGLGLLARIGPLRRAVMRAGFPGGESRRVRGRTGAAASART